MRTVQELFDLSGQAALVTGGAGLLGTAISESLAEAGARVAIASRNLDHCQETARKLGPDHLGLQLDIGSEASNRDVVDEVAERFGRLDILVGNAAMLGGLRPVGHYPPDVWEDVIALNLTANWRLIRSLDPLLRLSEAGRAMFVTSGVTEGVPPAYWSAYTASKAGLEALVRTYAAELKRTNLKVNIIDPGTAATNMRAEAFPGEDPNTLAAPDDITERFVELAEVSCGESGGKVFV